MSATEEKGKNVDKPETTQLEVEDSLEENNNKLDPPDDNKNVSTVHINCNLAV
jgi:hypothetical protein